MADDEQRRRRENRKRDMFGKAFRNFFRADPAEAQRLLLGLSPRFSPVARQSIADFFGLPVTFDASAQALMAAQSSGAVSAGYTEVSALMDQEEKARYDARILRAVGAAVVSFRVRNEEGGLRLHRCFLPYLDGGADSADRARFAYLFDLPELLSPEVPGGTTVQNKARSAEKAARRLDAVRTAAMAQKIRHEGAALTDPAPGPTGGEDDPKQSIPAAPTSTDPADIFPDILSKGDDR